MCIRLLSLDGALLPDKPGLQRELVASAQGLARAAALPGPLTDLRLPGGHVDALRMLWVQVRLCRSFRSLCSLWCLRTRPLPM